MALRKVFFVLLMPLALALSKEQENQEVKVKYATKAVQFFFNTCYFATSAAWGWSVLKDKPSLPWYIGGTGSIENFKSPTIFPEFDVPIYHYSLYTMGFHVQNAFTHIFLDERMNDFEEMLLHHIASFCLYFSYIFGNFHEVGATIAYLHDLADIPCSLTRAVNSTRYQNLSAFIFVFTICLWFLTRIYMLPQMTYVVLTSCIYEGDFAQFQPLMIISGVFLGVMCCLHAYWFCLFIKLLVRAATSGEVKDTLRNVEASVADNKAAADASGAEATKDGPKAPRRKGGKADKLE